MRLLFCISYFDVIFRYLTYFHVIAIYCKWKYQKNEQFAFLKNIFTIHIAKLTGKNTPWSETRFSSFFNRIYDEMYFNKSIAYSKEFAYFLGNFWFNFDKKNKWAINHTLTCRTHHTAQPWPLMYVNRIRERRLGKCERKTYKYI